MTAPRTAPISIAAREALLHAVEEVDLTWTDEGDHIEWDADRLPEALIALRAADRNLADEGLAAGDGPRDAPRDARVSRLAIHLHRKGVGCDGHREDDREAEAMHRDDAYDIVDFLANVPHD